MKRDKIYISGPVSSIGLEEARRRFGKAEADLQKQGYRTCNPMKMRFPVWLALHCGQFGYVACLLLQLLWMWWTCSCIYLLTDWHTSDGARLERSFARCLGLTALYEQKAASKREKRDTCISDSEREQARPQVKRKPSLVSKTAEAFAELGKAVAACGVNDKTIKPKSKKHKKD